MIAMPRTTADLAALELRRACFHEAAHAALLRLFGGVGAAKVWRNGSEAAAAGEEKAWCGQLQVFGWPGAVEIADDVRARLGIVRQPPSSWRRLVGLAGLVAESMLDGQDDPYEIVEAVKVARVFGEMSATDAELIGDEVDVAEVDQVIGLLSERWADVAAEASSLEAHALVTGD